MGCFNVNGFFSKLPLQANDDMIIIFCADMTRTGHNDSLPIYVAENYFPINAPIYCKYSNYGHVFENTVIKDANAEFFEKSIGLSCEKLCDLIHEFGNSNIEDLLKYNEEKATIYISLLKLLFNNAYYKWKNKIGLTYIMEHKDVYENISKLGKGKIYDELKNDEDIVSIRCNDAFELVKKHTELDKNFNLLRQNIVKNDFFSASCLLEFGYTSEFFPTYSSILGVKEWEKYKKAFIDFFRFTRVMSSLHRVLESSTYASQNIKTKILSAVNEIITNKTENICKKYEED